MTAKHENQKIREGYTHVIGCDEVGRGSLAGPVVAAAVILDPQKKVAKINDSKKLLPELRRKLDREIRNSCLALGLGMVEQREIDQLNIHKATLLALRRAVQNLLQSLKLDLDRTYLFIDGPFPIPDIDIDIVQQPVVGGDGKVLSVAAASIIAKVYRDNLMRQIHRQYPIYNFAQHKGYATLFHRNMILKHGLSEIHRRSFCKTLVLNR